jgi:3-keto-5-aminohexanoate cleavage enzyme
VDHLLITCAPTGAEAPAGAVPASPEALGATAAAVEQAGAAAIHVHARDTHGVPTLEVARVRACLDAVRAASDLVRQVSTGGDVSDGEEARLAVLDAGPESASLTLGTLNFGDEVFLNRWPFVVALHRRMRELGIVPEFECFDVGHVAALHRLLDREGPPHGGHVHVDIVCGVPGGMPGTPQALLAAVAMLPPGCSWSATGVGRSTLPIMLTALAAGGHLRVGLEDTTSFAPGEPAVDNAQLVRRAAEVARLAQRRTMTPDQARSMLGVRTASPVERTSV